MPEAPGRYVASNTVMLPTPGSYVVLFTVAPPPAIDRYIYGVDVCNGGAQPPADASGNQDAHIRICIIHDGDSWASPNVPPPYSRVVWNQRVECDATDGNVWVMPVKHLMPGDKVVVWTDTANVTFYGHGFLYS